MKRIHSIILVISIIASFFVAVLLTRSFNEKQSLKLQQLSTVTVIITGWFCVLRAVTLEAIELGK